MSGLSFSEKAQLCWAMWWRGAAVGVITTLISALLGALLGALLATVGAPLGAITLICGVVGFVPGAVGLYFYLSWLLRSRLGGRWRLVLVDELDESVKGKLIEGLSFPPAVPAADELAGLPESFATLGEANDAYAAAKEALAAARADCDAAMALRAGKPKSDPAFRVWLAAERRMTAAYGRVMAVLHTPVVS